MDRPLLSIVVVTFNSEWCIAKCLQSIKRQRYSPTEVLIIDNGSTDNTSAVVETSRGVGRFVKNEANSGFSAAHNQGIRLTHGHFYLALNPDVVMEPNFVDELVGAALSDPEVGSVSGKLLRPPQQSGLRLIDSAGMYMTPSLRHLDRGSGRPDEGQYERPQYVFGASGAAALYRRRMLENVAIDNEYFDEDFFAYREDADLAWRAQLLGWKALYTPRAVATHTRRVLPERRRHLPDEINMHSVKNRFLLRIKNQTWLEFIALLLPALTRDSVVLAYVGMIERSSLPGLVFVLRNLRRFWSKRRQIMSRRKASRQYMLRWFRYQPTAFECNKVSGSP